MNVIRTEINVGMPSLRLCGQIDAVALAKDGKSLVMIDWKRSKQLKTDPNKDKDKKRDNMKPPWEYMVDNARSRYAIQQNVYALAWREMYLHCGETHPIASLPFSKLYLLVLHPVNLDYVFIELPLFQPNTREMESMETMLHCRMAEIEEYLMINN
jgi:hypothetical protein